MSVQEENALLKTIIETHHVSKKDNPSGTAISLSNLLDKAEIISKRDGEVFGIHEIVFEDENERIIITHQAKDRNCFIDGVLNVATWIVEQKPGYYTYEDFLYV